MAGKQNYAHSEVKAGIFLFFCLALLIAMLFVYGDWSRYWRGRQTLSVVFASVTALRPEAVVRYNGVEVGRVKNIQIVHLGDANLRSLPELKKEHIDKLPFSDDERKKLHDVEASASEKEMRDLIAKKLSEKKRTMIKLALEVTNEKDEERFREDDDVRITTTLMGDSSIEIISGSGKPIPADMVILGRSGDFFTNLARSVEQVKEILGSVSDVVGKDEQESMRKALRRFDAITERLQSVVTLADTRLPKTWDRVDDLAKGAQDNFDKIGNAVKGVEPEVKETLKTASEAISDLREKGGSLAVDARAAVLDIKKDIKPIFSDLQYITSKSKDDIPGLVKNARELTARFQTSAEKLDAVLASGDRMLQESYPDVRRLVLALRLGAENFEEGTNVLKRKPWLIYNPAKEDAIANGGQNTAHDLEIASKRFAELSIELQAVRRNLDKAPKEKLERIDYILQELNILNETLKFAGDATRRDVLPVFERKKGAFTPVPEERDPALVPKKRPSDTEL